jgi:hypothetical protein
LEKGDDNSDGNRQRGHDTEDLLQIVEEHDIHPIPPKKWSPLWA